MPPDPVAHVVRYGAHPEQLADLRLPRERPSGLVLLVHGGFWRHEYDRRHTDPIAADLAARGYAVASVEYRRLGGAGGWPETFDDAAAAVDRVPALAAVASPQLAGLPVVLLGHSAGGHLVLWAVGRDRLPDTSRWQPARPVPVVGVVALAPVADLALAAELSLDDGVVEELLARRRQGELDSMAQLDPSRLPPAVPVIVLHGDRDLHVPLELSRRYVDAVRSEDVDVTLEVVVGAEHFALIDPRSSSWWRVLAALERLFRGG